MKEYFYALASTAFSFIIDVVFRVIDASGDKCFVTVDILSNISAFGITGDPFGYVLRNQTQSGWFQFNEDNEIIYFELSIYNLGKAVDPLDFAKPIFIQSICSISHFYCDGNPLLKNFENETECFEKLSSLPYGTWDRPYSNTTGTLGSRLT